MRYLLDADSAIDHLSQHIDLPRAIPSLLPRDFGLVATTLIELYTGVYGSFNPAQAERQLKHFLRNLTIIPMNQRVIEATASLRAELRARNLPISHRAFDLIAAATARAYNLTLITSNTLHFEDIPGLRLLNPRSP